MAKRGPIFRYVKVKGKAGRYEYAHPHGVHHKNIGRS